MMFDDIEDVSVGKLVVKSFRIFFALIPRKVPAPTFLVDAPYHNMPVEDSVDTYRFVELIPRFWIATSYIMFAALVALPYMLGVPFNFLIPVIIGVVPCLVYAFSELGSNRMVLLSAVRSMVARKGLFASPAVWLLDTLMWEVAYGKIILALPAPVQEVVVALADEWDGTFGELLQAAELVTSVESVKV